MSEQKASSISRRKALTGLSALAATTVVSPWVQGEVIPTPQSAATPVRKIATEEAFNISEIAVALKDMVKKGGNNLDNLVLKQIYDGPVANASPGNIPASDRDRSTVSMLPRLLDIDAIRLADMDANAVDMHLLSLTMPGVQVFNKETGTTLATIANDQLAEAVRKHPTRFAGLACFAPQDAAKAAKEMERGINQLKLNGFILNSHTNNQYLDDEQFLPVLEAAEALGYPLYLHPRAPSDGMAAPFSQYRLEGAVWGYGVETATHILRMIFGGIFDRFPKLQVVIGHMGEALPFWLWRLDFMGAPGARAGRKNKLKPSEYFQRNITITTSGVEDPLALKYCIEKIGVERIMWAIDYPYQPTAPAVAFIENASLSNSEREQIAYKNAERIFKLKKTS